jgi:hypothetical protein
VCFGEPLRPEGQGRDAGRAFTERLAGAMQSAEQAARLAIGRPPQSP